MPQAQPNGQEFVPLAQVETALQDLWRAEGGAGAARARTRNLVVVLPSPDQVAPTLAAMEQVAYHHPSRILLLVPNPETPDPGMAAQVRLLCPAGVTPTFCCEAIALHARPDVWPHLPTAVLVLLLPELPVYLWWRASLDPASPVFDRLCHLADVLVVDSGDTALAATPEDVLPRLGQVCPRLPWGCVDLVWTRVTPWREQVAQLFDPVDRRPFLRSVQRVSLTVEPTDLGTASALYFTAWLAERLGWTPRSRWRAGARSRDLRFTANGREVRVSVGRSHGPAASPLVRVRIHIGGVMPATFTVALTEEPNQAEVTVEIGNTRLRQVHLMRHPDIGLALSEALALNGRDWVYTQALRTALTLLGERTPETPVPAYTKEEKPA